VPEAGHLDRRRLRAARSRRRRRVAIVAGAAAVAVLVAGVAVAATTGLGGDDESAAGAPTPSTPPASVTSTTAVGTEPTVPGTVPASTAPAEAPPDIERRYAVGTFTANYVDTTRSTSPNGDFGGSPSRELPTTYWYPAQSDGGPPDREHGPYPMVLFVHGYDQDASYYAALLERWAAAGYVVAGPTFPILSGTPGGASHVDYTKLFGDAQFVIERTLAAGGDTPIGGLVDRNRISAAGHSDGEMVAFTMGFHRSFQVWPFRSILAMAGDLSYADVDPLRDTGLPILHIMETGDEYDPYPHSIQWDRDNLTPPRWLLTLVGATHSPPYTQAGNPYFELVSAATVDFLDGTLKDHPERLDAIATDVVAAPGVAELER
jgi:hypothetical protein